MVALQFLLNTKLVGKVNKSNGSIGHIEVTWLPFVPAFPALPAWVSGRGLGRRTARALPVYGPPGQSPLCQRGTPAPLERPARAPAHQGRSSQALPTHGSVRGADGKMGALTGKTRCAWVTASQRETGRSVAGAVSLARHCCPWPSVLGHTELWAAPAGSVCVLPLPRPKCPEAGVFGMQGMTGTLI